MKKPIALYSSSKYAKRLEHKYGTHLQDCPSNRVPGLIAEIIDRYNSGDPEDLPLILFFTLVLIDRTPAPAVAIEE